MPGLFGFKKKKPKIDKTYIEGDGLKDNNHRDDILNLLKSIDSRLETLESVVQKNRRKHGHRNYISTGHWNDK